VTAARSVRVHRRGFAVCVATALTLMAPVAMAVPATELTARARAAAARGDWNSAARSLEEIVRAGIDSTDVLYDLGTLYARAGRFGEAIHRFEQVARRNPLALDAVHNLRAARLLLANRDAGRTGRAVAETALPFWTWFAEVLPLDWSVWLTLFAQIAAIACIVVARRRNSGEMARVGGVAAAVLLTGVTLIGSGMAVARIRETPAGVVLHDGIRLRQSPSPDGIEEAAVREGERLEISSRNGAFVRAITSSGRVGWLSVRDVGELGE